MIEKLIIKDFGPIKAVNLDIKKTTVFIGPQSSGKSTVAKLLAIFRNIELVAGDDALNKELFDTFFEEYNISKYYSDGSFLHYKNDDYEIFYEEKAFRVEKTDVFREKIISEKDRITKLVTTLVEERYKTDTEVMRAQTIKQIYDYNWKTLFLLLKKQIYIPAERILTSLISESGFSFNEVSLPGCLKEFGKQFENTRARIKELNIPYLNITYKYEEKGENKGLRIYYDDSHSISLSESSSGIQAVIPMQVVMENFSTLDNSYSFLVEEPELNLFPTTQKNVVNYLIKKCNHKNELVVTTHSPYVLSVLNNLLFAGDLVKKNEATGNKIDIEKIKKIVPEEHWIDYDQFNAYYLADGGAKCILNPKTKLIFDNELDRVSQDIIGERDNLLELYKELI